MDSHCSKGFEMVIPNYLDSAMLILKETPKRMQKESCLNLETEKEILKMMPKDYLKMMEIVRDCRLMKQMETPKKTPKAIGSKMGIEMDCSNYSLTDSAKKKVIEMMSWKENWTETPKDSLNSMEIKMESLMVIQKKNPEEDRKQHRNHFQLKYTW
ncbi:MAG: hypothetical protein WC346_12700 [Methanogenium sp.]|jgi:hypothetical protein